MGDWTEETDQQHPLAIFQDKKNITIRLYQDLNQDPYTNLQGPVSVEEEMTNNSTNVTENGTEKGQQA